VHRDHVENLALALQLDADDLAYGSAAVGGDQVPRVDLVHLVGGLGPDRAAHTVSSWVRAINS